MRPGFVATSLTLGRSVWLRAILIPTPGHRLSGPSHGHHTA